MAKFLSQPDDEGLRHIGDIVTSFAVLEEVLSSLIRVLITENEQVGATIISDLTFNRKLLLARALCEVRMGSSEELRKSKIVFDEVDEIRKKRNDVVHSLWVSDIAEGTAEKCVKSVDWRKGVERQSRGLGVKELDEITDRVGKAIAGLLDVWRSYELARHN